MIESTSSIFGGKGGSSVSLKELREFISIMLLERCAEPRAMLLERCAEPRAMSSPQTPGGVFFSGTEL